MTCLRVPLTRMDSIRFLGWISFQCQQFFYQLPRLCVGSIGTIVCVPWTISFRYTHSPTLNDMIKVVKNSIWVILQDILSKSSIPARRGDLGLIHTDFNYEDLEPNGGNTQFVIPNPGTASISVLNVQHLEKEHISLFTHTSLPKLPLGCPRAWQTEGDLLQSFTRSEYKYTSAWFNMVLFAGLWQYIITWLMLNLLGQPREFLKALCQKRGLACPSTFASLRRSGSVIPERWDYKSGSYNKFWSPRALVVHKTWRLYRPWQLYECLNGVL